MEVGVPAERARELASSDCESFEGVACTVGDQDCGQGLLVVHQDVLAWLGPTPDASWLLPYPELMLHAVSASSACGAPCLFCQLSDDVLLPGASEGSSTVLLVPPEAATVQAMFDAVSAVSALHPGETEGEDGGAEADLGEAHMYTAADFQAPGAAGAEGAAGGVEGMELLTTEAQCDAAALAEWEAKFVSPAAALPGVVAPGHSPEAPAQGQFDEAPSS